jgi:hypothetical protein
MELIVCTNDEMKGNPHAEEDKGMCLAGPYDTAAASDQASNAIDPTTVLASRAGKITKSIMLSYAGTSNMGLAR